MKPTTFKEELLGIMADGEWHSIREIADRLKYSKRYVSKHLNELWLKRQLKRVHPRQREPRTLYILASSFKAREIKDGETVY